MHDLLTSLWAIVDDETETIDETLLFGYSPRNDHQMTQELQKESNERGLNYPDGLEGNEADLYLLVPQRLL